MAEPGDLRQILDTLAEALGGPDREGDEAWMAYLEAAQALIDTLFGLAAQHGMDDWSTLHLLAHTRDLLEADPHTKPEHLAVITAVLRHVEFRQQRAAQLN